MNEFKNAWIGYDLPYDEVERQPSVQAIRAAGVEKRVKLPEYHVTIAYFEQVDLDELTARVREAAAAYDGNINACEFLFDGFGQIKHERGRYVYFTPNLSRAREAVFLQRRINPEGTNLHVSIGGPDPFKNAKPMQHELKDPFTVNGSLVFVGQCDLGFRKFAWDRERQTFVDISAPSVPVEPAESVPHAVHTIAIFPKIQADTATAVYLLKNFGERRFPGIAQSKVVFWTSPPQDKTPEEYEREGYLLLDLGGRFDHHRANRESGKRTECLSTLVARAVGMEQNPIVKKLLAWAKRDDLEGKGTVSTDTIDRAFGLSGIIMNLNREFADDPEKTLNIVTTILSVHVSEEYRRHIELPNEWEALKRDGKTIEFVATQSPADDLKGVLVHSDNIALAGFLRAAHKFDVVVTRRSTGHASVISRQERSLDFRPVIKSLRVQEALRKGLAINPNDPALEAPGKFPGIDEWYYDDAANTLQNGGINPQGVPATGLTDEEILTAVREGLPRGTIGALKRQKEKERRV